jgi:hypothetical protein
MKSYTVVGYAYQATLYCVEHGEDIMKGLGKEPEPPFDRAMDYWPQPVFAEHVQEHDYCDACLSECIRDGEPAHYALLPGAEPEMWR